ncbi:hypothetical protein SGRIM128S_02846 [Streptomyces griseomycini]
MSDPAAGQAALVRDAIRDGVDGLALTLAKPQAMKGPVNEARAADIPVVGLNSGIDAWRSSGLLEYFGQDEGVAGRAVGDELDDLKAEHALCVVHERGNVALEARCAGVKKAFGGTTENLYVDGTDMRAVSGAITARLRQDPTIDEVVTNGADYALTAVDAVEEADSGARVATFDLSEELVDAVPAPSPVGVRAAMVAKGLAIEVEDRGLGLPEEDYASLNAQLGRPPQFDVVALADDLRLGMFVISQLAHRHGIAVTLRPSPYGGTTAIVLLPHEIVVRDVPPGTGRDAADGTGTGDPAAANGTAGRGSTGTPARADTAVSGRAAAGARPATAVRTAPAPAAAVPVARGDGLAPLPRRVPQTSLAAELREEPVPAAEDGPDDDFTAEHAASSLAGFQRGTLRARDDDGSGGDGSGGDAEDAGAASPGTSPPPSDH